MEELSTYLAKGLQWIVTFLLGVLGWFIRDKVAKMEAKLDAHSKMINDNENTIIRLERDAESDRRYVKESLIRLEKNHERMLDILERLREGK